jgi:rod shape-determining protein MreD
MILHMAWLKFAIYAYVALVLQTGLLPVVFPDSCRPWMLVILANLYLLSKPNEWTILLVWMVGFLGDLTSISPLGSQALAFGLYGILILTVRPILFTDSPLAHAITAGIGVIVIFGIYAIIAFFAPAAIPQPYSAFTVVGQAIATGIFAGILTKFVIPSSQKKAVRW